jgi:hypothetical protein
MAQARSPDTHTYVAWQGTAEQRRAARARRMKSTERMQMERTAVAVLAVQQLHGLANVIHMGGHAHEGEAGRAKERLGVLQRSAGGAHIVSL